jgi:hypothetical protein
MVKLFFSLRSFSMGRGMDDVPSTGKNPRWEEFVSKWEWDKNGGYKLARLFGDVVVDVSHNVETKTGKSYPEICHGWDIETCKFFEDKNDRCPCCALGFKTTTRYFMNAIDIELEEARPANAKANWTPIRLLSMPSTLFNRLKDLKPVNKGFAVSDKVHGAIVQIKFNKDAEAANMYSATMDTKSVPITEEQANYIVTQKYPDGTTKVVRGVDGLPAQFEYVRCMNSRDEMIKSLRRNNHYGETEAASAHSFDKSRPMSREETVAKIDAEASIETVDMSKIFAGDDTPPPPKPAKTAAPAEPKKKEPYDECPSSFGEFASTIDCFTKCDVSDECKLATDKKASVATPVKKTPAVVVEEDDDDDTV